MANWLDKYNDDIPNAQNGIEGTMGGLTDKGFNYNGAWGGTMQMGGSLPGSVGHMYARTISPAPSNGPYAKKTKASAQTGEAVSKGSDDEPQDDYIKLDPTKFSQTTTTGVSEAFDPTNSKWKGQSTEWLQKRIQNAELLVQAIKDAKSLPKKEWEEKYKGASFAAVGEGRAQPILPDFYNDYKKRDDAFIQDWSQARDQAKNELLMQSRWTANKDKAKKEALDFLSQYKNQNEFLSNIPTEASKKYGYTPGELENLSAWDFLSKDAVAKAYYAINSNQGFTLPQDPTNEMTCANGVCTIENMIGVDFSPLKGAKGVYYDKKTGRTIPQYNPTWLENDNYKKVGYRKLDPREFPQPGDIAQYTDEGVTHHMELVLDSLSQGQGLLVYNNYSQTNDNKPGEGKELRVFNPGTYQPQEFEKTEYFRLTPEAQQKALSRNPTYLKKLEAKKAFESSEDYKKFMETQEYIKANQEKYNKFNQLNPQDWRNGGRTFAQTGINAEKNSKNIIESNEWLTNWYKNRKIPSEQLQSIYEQDKPTYLHRLKNIPEVTYLDVIDNDPRFTGTYDSSTNELLMTPNAKDYVYPHELNHYANAFPSMMRGVNANVAKANLLPKEDVKGVYNEHYDYFSDPDEVHSRIQVLRKEAGFKPDEKVTPGSLGSFMNNYKGDNQQINDLLNISDFSKLLEMLNYMAANKSNKNSNVAQNGMEMKFYQEGLDWKPKNISRDGGLLSKYDCEDCKAQAGLSINDKRKKILERFQQIFDSGETPYDIPEQFKSVGLRQPVCIQGVCGVLSDAGVIPSGYYTNTDFANKSENLGLSAALTDINLLQPGDVMQYLQDENKQGNRYPSHAEIYKGVKEGDPNTLQFYDYFDYYNKPFAKSSGIREYTRDEIKQRLDRRANQDQSDIQAQFFSIAGSGMNPKSEGSILPEDYYTSTHELHTDYSLPNLEKIKPEDLGDRDRLKKDLVKLFNDESLDTSLIKKLKITDQDLQKIKPLVYGVLGQETNFGDPSGTKASLKYALENFLKPDDWSLGPGQIKLKSIPGKTRRAFDIKKDEDLYDINKIYPAIVDMVRNSAAHTDAYLKPKYNKATGKMESPHPELEDKDRFERGLYFYNSPKIVRKKDSELNSPLRMDAGSYPTKVLERAQELGRDIDFTDIGILPGVVITPEKKNGGWLNKYDDGGIIEDPMGQWAHPGEITKINSNQITMQGVDYPVLGISDTGDTQLMQPGEDYKFKGKSVTEIPMMQGGGEVIKVKQPDGSFKTYNTDSEEYRKLYDSGHIQNYDKKTDTYISKPLDEVVITGQAPEKGFWDQSIDAYLKENKDAGFFGALGSVATYPLGLAQQAMMYGLTGKVQRPSEAMGIKNPLGALATDVIADPLNLFGVGLTDDALRLTSRASKFLTEETALKNAYKINPWAFKPNESNWYRQVGEEAIDDALNTGLIRESREEVSPRMWREFQDQIKRLQGDDALSYEEKYKQQILSSRRPTSPFFAKGELFYPMGRKPTITKSGKISKNAAGKGNADYLIETGLPNESFQPAYGKGMSAGVPTEIGQTAILKPNPSLRDIENFKLYKQDWLRGYKELPIFTQNTGDVGNLAQQMKQMNRFFSEDQRFDRLKETTNPESLNMLSDFKKRISTPEGKRRMKELGITREDMLHDLTMVEDPTSYGYYRPSKNKIAIHPDIPLPRFVGRHETEHSVQKAFQQSSIDESNKWYNLFSSPKIKKTTKIDDLLSDLELWDKPDLKKVWDKSKGDVAKPIDVSDYEDLILDRQLATDYFTTGSKGGEKSAFLAEAQQWMMDQGMIPKDDYVEVTPEMVKQAYDKAKFDKTGRYLRIFNIMRPTEKNYKKISKGLNELLTVSPIALGAGAIGSQTNQPTQQKNGGWLNKYE